MGASGFLGRRYHFVVYKEKCSLSNNQVKVEPKCACFFTNTGFFLKLNILFFKVTNLLMRTHFEATLIRQKSKGSRCSNTFNIQSSCWSKCLKSELGYCVIKIDEVQAENPYKEALYSMSRQTSCDVFSGLQVLF